MSPRTLDLIPVLAISNGSTTLPDESGRGAQPREVSPEDAMASWEAQGAYRVQIRDEDTITGTPDNTGVVRRIIHRHHSRIKVDLVAGTATIAELDDWMKTDVATVVLAASVAADPDVLSAAIARAPHRISLGLDVMGGSHLVSPGTPLQGADLWGAIPGLDALGVPHYTLTDLAHHDHWKHGNLHLMETFCQTSARPVTCGAGIKTLADLHQLQPLTANGLDGVVIGHALENGAFSFSDAVAALEARYDPYQWGPAPP
ncbi:MAG: HisA/HisF-related TIM barrel protein [Candidatus Nanopelagicales bacterium]